MSEENGRADGGRSRVWGGRWAVAAIAGAAVAVIGGGTAAVVALTGSNARPRPPTHPAAVVQPSRTPASTHPVSPSPTPTGKPVHKAARPTPSPGRTYAPRPTSAPVTYPVEHPTTYPPQQNCYDPPHPTCTIPPPPSSLKSPPWHPPSTQPIPGPTISE